MQDMLTLSSHLPTVTLAAGETLVREGESAGAMWVLVSGSLQIVKNGQHVNAVKRPGSVIGEISVLLDSAYSATVVAAEPTVLRFAADGRALLESDPAITSFIAVGLAERLNFITTYLADLKNQYGDAPGLAMIPDVLRELAQKQGPRARPGSLRDPGID